MTEFDLVSRYFEIKDRIAAQEAVLQSLKNEQDRIEYELAEHLFDNRAERTAKYKDLGGVTMTKPDLFAYVRKDDEWKLFEWLKDQDMADVIKTKTDVHRGTLASLVKTYLIEGKEVPQFIQWSVKPKLRGYKS